MSITDNRQDRSLDPQRGGVNGLAAVLDVEAVRAYAVQVGRRIQVAGGQGQ